MSETKISPDATAYLRAHTWMAAVGMAAAMGVLWVMDSPHIWTGAVGGLAAIALRGFYARKEELAAIWTLTSTALVGPTGHSVPLASISGVKSMGSYVQVITTDGQKYLIKYQADPAATIAAIERARL
ncbi:hypothetical protein QEZ52_04890 [Aliisedimentitalea scapharcae]|uniref:PH domain-containing protein n=1 Tax=Aliisedimentitalea scapharcae TaxID=1524259 RepID=A0ABZ2XWX5_9RHOB|nr:hypothetical protein K3727_04785 [Rhodobacteraceae bacterium M382]